MDEVLSSIKDMITGTEPPVLELTDMIAEDGSIVKIEKNKTKSITNPDMKSFLRLIQENTDVTFADPKKDGPVGKANDCASEKDNGPAEFATSDAVDFENQKKLPRSRIETSIVLTSESLMSDDVADCRSFSNISENSLDSGEAKTGKAESKIDATKNIGTHKKASTANSEDSVHCFHGVGKNDAAMSAALMDFISPTITQWIKDNLPGIVSKIVENEVKKIFGSR